MKRKPHIRARRGEMAKGSAHDGIRNLRCARCQWWQGDRSGPPEVRAGCIVIFGHAPTTSADDFCSEFLPI